MLKKKEVKKIWIKWNVMGRKLRFAIGKVSCVTNAVAHYKNGWFNIMDSAPELQEKVMVSMKNKNHGRLFHIFFSLFHVIKSHLEN